MDIIEHIKSRGMTVAAAARLAGVSRQTIYALGDQDYDPSVKTVVSVARAIGVTPSQIKPELAE
jgi:DNA-binding XRE family transcriptional regulator